MRITKDLHLIHQDHKPHIPSNLIRKRAQSPFGSLVLLPLSKYIITYTEYDVPLREILTALIYGYILDERAKFARQQTPFVGVAKTRGWVNYTDLVAPWASGIFELTSLS